MSLSARRAWIEIPCAAILSALVCVALRKESVDRNTPAPSRRKTTDMSLSARRAWIEIDIDDKFGGFVSVALRKESVDRNQQRSHQA